MKYKVGDKVRVRKDLKADKWYGDDRVVDAMMPMRGIEVTISQIYNGKYRIKESAWWWTDEMFEPKCDRKILITSDGTETLARLYDGKKVVKTSKAKCLPEDVFDFATGAKLAFERLIGEDKPKVKPEVKPVVENPKEILLYCVKDDKPGIWMTKGKLYKMVEGQIKYDSLISIFKYSSWDSYKQANPIMSACLVPLVKRPAKVGEWVYITNAHGARDAYKNGDVLRVIESSNSFAGDILCFIAEGKKGNVSDGKRLYVDADEYLVLDGYQPEEEKKPEPKPEYYNGKVVCTMGSCFHTKGKVYEVKDGVINDDSPCTGLYNPGHPKKTLEELGEPDGPQFIPFVEDKPSFDWAGFKRRDFAVNCDTKEKAKAFLAECYQHGLFWSDRDVRKTMWGVHEANTCYSFSFGTLGYTEKSWYKKQGIKVIPYR